MALTDSISINSILGEGSSISGDLKINGFARVDGDVDGNIEATNNIIIGDKARVKGNITATSATIHGVVLGDVYAPLGVKLMSTSAVIGDIITKKLIVEENVIIHGHCISLHDESEYNDAFTEYTDEHAIRNRVL